MIWTVPLEQRIELWAVDPEWKVINGMIGRAWFGRGKTGKILTDRGWPGAGQRALFEADTGSLVAVNAGRDVPDCKSLEESIRVVVVEPPDLKRLDPHLSASAALGNPINRQAVKRHSFVRHVRPSRGGLQPKRRPGRRRAWYLAVQQKLSWHSKCWTLLVRYEVHAEKSLWG